MRLVASSSSRAGPVASFALSLAVLALTACGGRTEGSASQAPRTAERSAGAALQRAGDAGVTVALPPDWHSLSSDDGAIIDPVTRLVVSSSPIRPKLSSCQIAAYSIAEDAVALVVVEWAKPPPVAPQRPRQFTSRELSVLPAPVIECYEGLGGSVQFVDRGRTFGAYLLVGADALDSLVVEARRVLDTLRVEPAATRQLARNGVALAVPRGWDGRLLSDDDGPRGCPRPDWPGPWTACAEADWVRRVVQTGGYRVVGGTGSALVAEGKGRSFYVWTTRARRGVEASAAGAGHRRRLAVVDGTPVYGDEQLWRFWVAQGFVFWVNEGPRADSIAPSPIELRGVLEASEVLPPPLR